MHYTTSPNIGQVTPEMEGRSPSLDTIAKFTSPCPVEPSVEEVEKWLGNCLNGYSLHTHIRHIWGGSAGRRVRACHYYPQAAKEDDVVQVYKDVVNKRAYYERLQTCASRWSCPICSPKLAVRRARELRKLTSWGRQQGYRLMMMTLTSRHSDDEPLYELLEKQGRALALMRIGKRSLKRSLPYTHWVRCREVTVGINGWHPHYHEILFLDPKEERRVEDLRDPVFKLWHDMSRNAGLPEPDIKAFDLTDCNERIADYVSKYGREPHWTEAEEVTLGQRKKARGSSLTPWGLLNASFEGDLTSRARWIEFSEAIKNERQVRCSPGLKQAAGVADLSDEQVVQREGEGVRQWFSNIPASVWEQVRRRFRAQLLQVAATSDKEAFEEYLCYALLRSYEDQ